MTSGATVFALTIKEGTSIKSPKGGSFNIGGSYLYVSKDGDNISDIQPERWGGELKNLIDTGDIKVEKTLQGKEVPACDVTEQLLGEPVFGFGTQDCSCDSHLFKYISIEKGVHDATHTPYNFTIL